MSVAALAPEPSAPGPPQPAMSAAPTATPNAGVNASTAAASPLAPEIARPYSFFPLNNHPTKSDENEPIPISDEIIVHPDDDPAATSGIPIFKPTMEEFKDFDVYMEKVVPWGMRSSIVKIIPPKEWVEQVELIDKQAMSELQIRSPIEQIMLGKNGVFAQRNVERMRNRPLSIREWFDKCAQKDFATPNPKEIDRTTDRDSREFKEWQKRQKEEVQAAKLAKKEKRMAAAKRKEERIKKAGSEAGAQSAEVVDNANANANAEAGPSTLSRTGSAKSEPQDDLPALENSSNTTHSTPERIATPQSDTNTLDPFYETVDLKKDWLPDGVEAEDYTVQGCANIERKFWKTIGMGRSSWYGADLAGSLFADPTTPWNVATLPNLLRRLKNKLPGVNTPYLYFGMWRAAFSWHVEDMDLFSINYIHFGAPKFWYAVPQVDADRFESVTRSYFPKDANGCAQFLRHKACTLSPTKLYKEGIRVNKMVQHQNEFVITFPRGYHAGFNVGFNCAESANFALPCWVPIGKRAKACECVNFSVRIDVDSLIEELNTEQVKEEEEVKEEAPKPRKRKAEGDTPGSARRRRKVEVDEPASKPVDEVMDIEPPTPTKEPKKKITIIQVGRPSAPVTEQPKPPRPAAIAQPPPPSPCVLCPSLSVADLAPVFEPSDHIRSLSKTPLPQAHISCAVAVPEAYTEDLDIGGGPPATVIKGLDNIGKDRWKLKCSTCTDARSAKMGTKIQCTKGKCTRAFHVSCARENEMVHYSAGHKDEQSPFVVELLCPTHNPMMVEIKKARATQELREKVLAIEPGSQVKFKKNGSSMAATLVQVNPVTSKVQVEMPDGTVKEVAWSALDFRPSEVHMQENEYAGPPKRSRKLPMPTTPVTGYVTRPFTQPPPHTYMPPPGYLPNAASYVQQPFPTANHAVMVDSHHRYAHHSHHHPPLPPQHYHPQYHTLPQHHSSSSQLSQNSVTGPGRVLPDHPISTHQHTSAFTRVHPPPPQQILGYTAPRPPQPMASASASQGHAHSMGAPPSQNGQSNGRASSDTSAGGPSGMADDVPVVGAHVKLGLGRMNKIMAGLPPLRIPAIHLAGTNGKGSVSALLESCLMAAGFRVLRYNSPFLVEPRDALRINGELTSVAEYAAAVAEVERIRRERKLNALPFELTTAAAFLIASQAQPPIDIMIVECGMGGARDCTNVLPKELTLTSVLTTVGLDHTDRIGSTITEIAQEKTGIVVPGGMLIVGPTLVPDAMAVAQQTTRERGAVLIQSAPGQIITPATPVCLKPFRAPESALVRVSLPTRPFDARQSLPGAHQTNNLALAITILDVLRQDQRALHIVPRLAGLTDAHIHSGVARTQWAGRCSWLEVDVPTSRASQRIPILADGAHNEDSSTTLRNYIESLNTTGPRTYLLSLSHSPTKTPESILSPLLRPGDRVALMDFTTPVEEMPWIFVSPREPVRTAVRKLLGPTGEVYEAPGAGPEAVMDALKWASRGWAENPGLIVFAGSLYFVADLYRIVQAQRGRPGVTAKV